MQRQMVVWQWRGGWLLLGASGAWAKHGGRVLRVHSLACREINHVGVHGMKGRVEL